MKSLDTEQLKRTHGLDIEVLVKNERVLVCKVKGTGIGPFYLHYHAVTGWKDLDNGDTSVSRQMASVVPDPFGLC